MNATAVRVMMVHGNQVLHWSEGWFAWGAEQLQGLGIEVFAETMPDSILARAEYWIPFIKEYGRADERTILIGHSSGATAAMRYAEENKILGSILISPTDTDLDDELEKQSGYFDAPWDWNAIRQNQEWIVQLGSTDDPYIPVEVFRNISKYLDTEYLEYTDRGHFSDVRFPEVINIVKEKLSL